MKDLLNAALCQLDDRHIAEAATYSAQTKTIRFKKILPIAVCFVLVLISAFAVKNHFSPGVTPTNPTYTTSDGFVNTDNFSTTVAGVTDKSTTVAHAPEITSTTALTTTSAGTVEPDIQLYCTAPMKDYTGWENHAFLSIYHEIKIGDALYYARHPLSSSAKPLPNEDLGSLLYEFTWNDFRFNVDGSSDFIVQVYELKDWSKEDAIAVGRKDGLMKGYYIYYKTSDTTQLVPGNVLTTCQSLSDIISFADITTNYNPDNFCTSFWVYYKQDGKEDIPYSICVQDMEKLALLIINNSDAKAEERKSDTGEKLTYNACLKGYNCEIYLCNDGYLYISNGETEKAFNIGVENYEKYISDFKYGHQEWTPENPVTMG